ncbi:MAG: hypothetical protein KC589_08885 [Nanoarchaeota archaeon]|nr:hypothetical protein [Nanoarchaeota archaeon]MCA9497035.1 hypothetical protein [Nanoarchaeota archaeon]
MKFKKKLRRFLARHNIDKTSCQSCGGNLRAEGYYFCKCVECRRLYFFIDGNLASEGKGYRYREEQDDGWN